MFTRPPAAVSLALIAVSAVAAGCSPATTRFPTCTWMGSEYQRREAQIQDPYPDSRMGPDTQSRPLGFVQQRSQVQISKDRFGAAVQKQRYGNPFAPPPVPTSQYPEAVELR